MSTETKGSDKERTVDTPLGAARKAWAEAKERQDASADSGDTDAPAPLEAAVAAALQKDRARAGLSRRFNTQMQNKLGEWVPAIPMPFLGFRRKCECGAKFWTLDGYRGHYALKHVLDPEPTDAN